MSICQMDGILVQGITGKQARFWTARMRESGTRIVAGVSPGKSGSDVEGVPVYGTVSEAAERHLITASVLFVPPLSARDAALEAMEAGISTVVLLAEHVPVQETMEVVAASRELGTRLIGPNTAGLVTPGEGSLGIMPGHESSIFRRGGVGIVSRSGSLGTLICHHVLGAGYGQSGFVGVGGDPIVGTSTREVVEFFDQDPATSAVVVVGEVGGNMEEETATYVAEMTKPVVAFIAGRTAPPGRRMGHAGALVVGNAGSAAAKIGALRDAGAVIAALPTHVGHSLRELGVRP